MKQNILFYCFMAILIVASVIMILGEVEALQLEQHHSIVLGTFLIERTSTHSVFVQTFSRSAKNMAYSFGTAIEAFDQISDEITLTIDNRQPYPDHVHRF